MSKKINHVELQYKIDTELDQIKSATDYLASNFYFVQKYQALRGCSSSQSRKKENILYEIINAHNTQKFIIFFFFF